MPTLTQLEPLKVDVLMETFFPIQFADWKNHMWDFKVIASAGLEDPIEIQVYLSFDRDKKFSHKTCFMFKYFSTGWQASSFEVHKGG